VPVLEWLELLVQPVAVVGWGLVAIAWLARRGAPALRWGTIALALGYFALATPLGANGVTGALERAATTAADACGPAADRGAIVVLAGGMTGHPSSPDDIARLQVESIRRVFEAVSLARSAGEAPVIVAGGSGGPVREADLMASLASAQGLAPERVLLERESRTTAEAASHVASLLTQRRLEAVPVRLVTSALHMPRAAAAFRRRGLAVCPVPVDTRFVWPALHAALVPQATALEKSTAAWHELVGYAVYWATGRL
jgi:uncharacterized SAM-binding protein YcdF (DUF218 family)